MFIIIFHLNQKLIVVLRCSYCYTTCVHPQLLNIDEVPVSIRRKRKTITAGELHPHTLYTPHNPHTLHTPHSTLSHLPHLSHSPYPTLHTLTLHTLTLSTHLQRKVLPRLLFVLILKNLSAPPPNQKLTPLLLTLHTHPHHHNRCAHTHTSSQ